MSLPQLPLVPKGSTSVMARRAEPPDSLDFFPTPPWATRALFRHVLPALEINVPIGCTWEPACGAGHMAAVIEEFAAPVIASDIFDYGYGTAPHDFINDAPLVEQPQWIITNPPFASAIEFALRALEMATDGVALLVRGQWLESAGRYEKLFRDRPPAIFAPFAERVPMVKGRWVPDASTATGYAWFVWHRDKQPCRVFWIPPGCKAALTLPDDRERFAAWSLEPDAPSSLFEGLNLRTTSGPRVVKKCSAR